MADAPEKVMNVADLYEVAVAQPVEGEKRPGFVGGIADLAGAIWAALKGTWSRLRVRVSFWTAVGTVALTTTAYYFVFAESMYVAATTISIQNKSAMSSGVSSILGGALGTSATGSQGQQIYDFIYSQDMLNILDKQFHLRELYSSPDRNPFWRLWWPQTSEDFLWFYQFMVEVDNQSDVGIMQINVLDYDRVRAKAIADRIVAEAEKFINNINTTMQKQTMRFAQNELENSVRAVQAAKTPNEQTVAELRLSAAQQALAAASGAANQQSVFIVPIATAALPTEPTRPQRLFDILSASFLTAVVYAVGFLMWSNVRDHRKA